MSTTAYSSTVTTGCNITATSINTTSSSMFTSGNSNTATISNSINANASSISATADITKFITSNKRPLQIIKSRISETKPR